MNRAILKWLLVLTLVGGSTGGASSIAMASQHDQLFDYPVVSKLYYPYVPNDDMIGETGPWHGSITVQNLENVPVEFWVLPDGRFDPDRALTAFWLDSHSSRTLTADELGVEEPGSSLVVAAMKQSIWLIRNNQSRLDTAASANVLKRPKIAGTVKQSAGAPMEDGIWTSDAQEIVDGYAAIPMDDVGWGDLAINCPSLNLNSCAAINELTSVDGVSYLPLAQTNNQWNTVLYVTNVDGAIDGESMVKVELNPSADSDNDATWSEEMRLTPGETWAINVSNEVGAEWIGSVRVSSGAGTAAVAARYKSATDMLLMNTSAPSLTDDGSGYRLSAPLIFNEWGGWNTGFSLSNQSDSTNNVEVRFYDADGEEAGEASASIAGNGHAFIYLPSEVENEGQQGWIGSAILESTNGHPFHAAVDQVNYENGAAMSYTVGAQGAVDALSDSVRPHLGLPLLQKPNLAGDGDTTGIQLFNPDPEHSVQADIHLYSSSGAPISLTSEGPVHLELGPLSGHTFYTLGEGEIPLDSSGSVVVSVTSGSGQIMAVSNLVNYNVQGDGAVVFGLSNGSGQFR